MHFDFKYALLENSFFCATYNTNYLARALSE